MNGHFTWLFAVPWRDDRRLESACLDGYGRTLTENERSALTLFAVMSAVHFLHSAVRDDDAEATTRLRFLYGRLTSEFYNH